MYETLRERSSPLSGMGGWLAFLVVSLVMIWPLAGLMTTDEGLRYFGQHNEIAASLVWQEYSNVIWMLFVLRSVLSILAGYRLYRVRDRESVHFAIDVIWLAGPVLNLVSIMTGIMVVDTPLYAGVRFWEMVLDMGLSVLLALLWTAYLKRSVRVENTYKLP